MMRREHSGPGLAGRIATTSGSCPTRCRAGTRDQVVPRGENALAERRAAGCPMSSVARFERAEGCAPREGARCPRGPDVAPTRGRRPRVDHRGVRGSGPRRIMISFRTALPRTGQIAQNHPPHCPRWHRLLADGRQIRRASRVAANHRHMARPRLCRPEIAGQRDALSIRPPSQRVPGLHEHGARLLPGDERPLRHRGSTEPLARGRFDVARSNPLRG